MCEHRHIRLNADRAETGWRAEEVWPDWIEEACFFRREMQCKDMRLRIRLGRTEKRDFEVGRFRRRVRDRECRFVAPAVAADAAAEDRDEEVFRGVGGERVAGQQTAGGGQQERRESAGRRPLCAVHFRSVQYRFIHSSLMCALLFAVSAAAAIACLRLATPLSRRAMIVLALLPLCLTGRALYNGWIYAPVDIAYTNEPLASLAEEAGVTRVLNPAASDVFAQFLPWHAAMREAVRDGQSPLWNRFDSIGHPLLGAAQVAPLHPVTMLGLLLPAPDEPAFAASMLFLLAALSMFALLRELKVAEIAASFGAAAWMLSTYLVSFAGTAHGLSLSVLPLVLLGARRVARKANVRAMIVLIIALLLLVLSGHPETTLHVVALGIAFFFFEWMPRPRRNALFAGLGAGAITLLLAAIYLLPIFDTLDQTREVHERTAIANVHAGATELAHRLRVNLLPFLEGQQGEPAMHEAAVIHGWFSTTYSGSLLFAPAIYTLLFVRDRRRWFFGGLLLFGLAAGVKLPGLADVLARLPGFSLALNERMLAFAAFALALLAAIGVDEFIKERRRALAMLFIATAIVFVVAFIAAQPAIHAAALSRSFIRLHAMRMFVPLFFGAAVALGIRSRRHAAIALLALLLIQRAGETST